jgi:hypothetical protein
VVRAEIGHFGDAERKRARNRHRIKSGLASCVSMRERTVQRGLRSLCSIVVTIAFRISVDRPDLHYAIQVRMPKETEPNCSSS